MDSKMDVKTQTAQDDLAFLRNLVESSSRSPMPGGALFLAGGLLYGVQTLFHWIHAMAWITPPTWVALFFSIAPTIAFLIVLTRFLVQQKKQGTGGIAKRALDAAFAAAGLCNLTLALVFGFLAFQQKSLFMWLLYPIVVFSLQGAAWQTAFRLQGRAWMGFISYGWFAGAVGLGLTIGTTHYILVVAACLFLLMALPGALMLRTAKTTS